ncbi:peptide methionine sulfoxide reductase [Gramella aestuarii]|uniref:peptide-methionine (S)-S-oxide reductase n=1 Tax=Christiangramia aestuarii TaxID=1028746 RepID=A0A7K1LPU2_9FLAO|nr:peptide methionine sulfoxide reductase [Christiangramia aestuarii]
MKLEKIGFGGGCHWCTEAVFQYLNGVDKVEQGYISTSSKPELFYEAVIVHFDPKIISQKTLIRIHLSTHKSSSDHSMRYKYLSAVYSFEQDQHAEAESILSNLSEQDKKFITRVYKFGDFKASREEIRNYYATDPKRPFCRSYIQPKLEFLDKKFSKYLKNNPKG